MESQERGILNSDYSFDFAQTENFETVATKTTGDEIIML